MTEEQAERLVRALERIADGQDRLVEVMAAVGQSNAALVHAITTADPGEELQPGPNLRTMDDA